MEADAMEEVEIEIRRSKRRSCDGRQGSCKVRVRLLNQRRELREKEDLNCYQKRN
ncbi:hypothetical protein B7P43_G03747 [Cryptotermes secundus]|uniref:Uncharacterized protein n=1 Tax=Cryptotermes secundus TaxID=105785 RepID=A0A2J7R1Z1_9NEOP|nr:hypothetical protein B7P43_G03747 [Cryptotermes secundus]